MKSTTGVHQQHLTKSAEEIRSGVKVVHEEYDRRISSLVSAAKSGQSVSFASTFGALADADGFASLASVELTLPALVSGDPEARAASASAKKSLSDMWSKTYTRPDLYEILHAAKDSAETTEEIRLVTVVLEKFRQSGCGLTSKDREELASLDRRCKELAFQVEQNINEDCSSVDLTVDELFGCEESFIQSLPSPPGSSLKRCSLKAPVLGPIMQRAHSSSTRRRMLEASQQRCEKNGPLLEEILSLRQRAAERLGFRCHAERVTSQKMAGTADAVRQFCEDMQRRLRPLRDAELLKLSSRKQRQETDPEASSRKRKLDEADSVGHCLDAWDMSYYTDLLQREELHLDDAKVKEFFPLEGTIQRILEVYSELLGLRFERNAELPVWHEEVVAFEVKESKSDRLVGHLYLDQFPRDGKFAHQMILPLAPAFTSIGECLKCVPACVNISNFARPEGDRPALLRLTEMKTLFHELGHAMHCLCTQTRFSILSWAWPMVPWPGGVEQDFLEVPSMALEKFAGEPSLLHRVARHFSGDGSKLDATTIEQIQKLERFMAGTQESRLISMSMIDLLLHSQAPPYSFDGQAGLSPPELYRLVVERCTSLKQLPNTNFCASWYHLYIGYDAGVYGYAWSDVFAADIFESMRNCQTGPLSAETGKQLRSHILEPCATKPGHDMLRGFLGREPSVDAWCRFKGIQ